MPPPFTSHSVKYTKLSSYRKSFKSSFFNKRPFATRTNSTLYLEFLLGYALRSMPYFRPYLLTESFRGSQVLGLLSRGINSAFGLRQAVLSFALKIYK